MGNVIFKGEVYLPNHMNVWSFILSLFCILVFFIVTSSANFITGFTRIIGIHPLNIVLVFTLIAFILGVIGLKDAREWKAMARSIFTIISTIAFSTILIVILFFGSLLG